MKNEFEIRMAAKQAESEKLAQVARRVGMTVGVVAGTVAVMFLAAAILGLVLLIKVIVGAL